MCKMHHCHIHDDIDSYHYIKDGKMLLHLQIDR